MIQENNLTMPDTCLSSFGFRIKQMGASVLKKNKTYILICLACFSIGSLQSQSDSAQLLDPIVVESIRQSANTIGSKTQKFDSLSLERNPGSSLAELLSGESPIFIKSYGSGGLASTSFRGGSAAHTSLLWGGVPINSPTNGQLDLSLIPSNFFNNASISYGGGSTLWGSGAIGGSIHVRRSLPFNEGYIANVNSQVGSFGRFGNQASVGFSSNKYSGFVGSSIQVAQNNFDLVNIDTEESIGQQTNSQFNQQSIYTEHKLKLNSKNQLGLAYWMIQNERNIPPTLSEKGSNSKQEDFSHRARANYQYTSEKLNIEARGAYMNESIGFLNDAINIETDTKFQTIVGQVESKYQINQNHALVVGISNTYSSTIGDNYSTQPSQNQLAGFASYLFKNTTERLKANLSIRQEILDLEMVPVVYSAGMNYEVSPWFNLRAKASKDFRIPTINDRFWSPGGVENLLPESGFSQEIGAKLHKNTTQFTSSFDATLFNRNIDNWILWLPNAGYWSPRNILLVWSRGMETATRFSYQKGDWALDLNIMTNYVLTTSQNPTNKEDQSTGLQMIYVPMYSGNARAMLSLKTVAFSWTQNYTGYRYTASDHSQFLERFWLSSAFLSWKPKIKSFSSTAYLRVNNIFNSRFQQIQNRPMPGRNFLLGLNLSFRSKK
jgi:vitamin B12 transporter